MKKREPRSLGEYLHEWIESSPIISEKLLEVKAISYLLDKFNPMKGFFKNCYIQKGTLYISVSSSTLKNAIFINRENIKNEINTHIKYYLIERIIVR